MFVIMSIVTLLLSFVSEFKLRGHASLQFKYIRGNTNVVQSYIIVHDSTMYNV